MTEKPPDSFAVSGANLEESLREWASKRGELRSVPAVELAELSSLDRKFYQTFCKFKNETPWRLQQSASYVQSARLEYQRARSLSIQRALLNFGNKRGRTFGRMERQDLREQVDREIADYLQAQALLPETAELFQPILQNGEILGKDDSVEAERLATLVHKAIGGLILWRPVAKLLSDRQKLWKLLEPLTPEMTARVFECYQGRYQISFRENVLQSFRGQAQKQLLALSEGRILEAYAYALYFLLKEHRYLRRPTKLLLKLRDLCHGFRKKELASLIEVTDGLLISEGANQNLFALLAQLLPKAVYPSGEAYLAGSRYLGDAIFLRYLKGRRRQSILIAILAEYDINERQEISRVFQQNFNETLESFFDQTLIKGPLRDLCLAFLGNDPARIDAAKIACGLGRVRGMWLGQFFLKQTKERREYLQEIYKTYYPQKDLLTEVKKRFFGQNREILVDLITFGSVGIGKLLWFCVAGLGTDERGLTELLEHATPSELALAASEYHTIWTERAPRIERFFPNLMGNLRRRVWLECGGDSWFELREILETPQVESELAGRLQRLYRHERSGRLLKKLDFFSREGQVMDEDVNRIRNLEVFQERDSSFTPLDKAARDRRSQFETLVRIAELDCQTFRALKQFIGNSISNIVAGISACTVALTLPFFAEDIRLVMGAVAFASCLVRYSMKSLLKGDGYHQEEILGDLLFGIIDGMTLFASQLFRQALVQNGSRFASKLGLKSGIQNITKRLNVSRADAENISLRDLALPIEAEQNDANVVHEGGFSGGKPTIRDTHELDRRFEEILLEFYLASVKEHL